MILFKKNKIKPKYQFFDINNNMIFEGELEDIELKEEIIIQKSIEFFSDANPCYIHKSAVMSRLYAELNTILDTLEVNNSILAKDILDKLNYIKDNQNLKYIKRIL